MIHDTRVTTHVNKREGSGYTEEGLILLSRHDLITLQPPRHSLVEKSKGKVVNFMQSKDKYMNVEPSLYLDM